ncbi:LPS export ABC transporter periplasmic protein LptC [Aquirhabdus parva]|uniref:LPS export ABC transporter periplasmic protein LptC n=1 Tax=Aquirhabdus parva TaxID=2283318 RepID=A0A345P5W4_9GAMM|nr:LPS export ABC transporter periplasmic protein LptC [Aquirhabdus parva]AXI02673.1 LPS export ABC transporter periplasmic protein LptC [Aquirhabdus parva]
MSTRILYLIALIFMAASVLFYSLNREKVQKQVATHSDIDFSASTINARQTDEQGQIQNQLQADALRHYPDGDRMELDQITSTWYKGGLPQTTLNADKGVSFQNNDKVVLTGNVHVQQLAKDGKAPTDLYTTVMNGYPKTKQVDTDQVVTIKSAQSNLVSQGVRADLNIGQYEFFKLRGIYATPRP